MNGSLQVKFYNIGWRKLHKVNGHFVNATVTKEVDTLWYFTTFSHSYQYLNTQEVVYMNMPLWQCNRKSCARRVGHVMHGQTSWETLPALILTRCIINFDNKEPQGKEQTRSIAPFQLYFQCVLLSVHHRDSRATKSKTQCAKISYHICESEIQVGKHCPKSVLKTSHLITHYPIKYRSPDNTSIHFMT